jgi:two-component system OmpR family response regulator
MISRVRQKLGDDARAPLLIKTVRSEGYVLAAPAVYE